MRKRTEKRRRKACQVLTGFAHDVAGHEFGRILEHVNEAVQFTQHVVGNGGRGLGFAVKENRHVGIRASDLTHEGTQLGNGFVFFSGIREVVVIETHDEGRSAACLTSQT